MSEYRHLVGGEVEGRRHEAGDPVDPATPPRKLQEWLKAGIIKRAKKPQERKDDK